MNPPTNWGPAVRHPVPAPDPTPPYGFAILGLVTLAGAIYTGWMTAQLLFVSLDGLKYLGGTVLLACMTAGGLVTGLSSPPRPEAPPEPLPGAASRWASPEELAAHGLIKAEPPGPHELLLGWEPQTSALIAYPGEKSVITYGPSGSGKLATVIVQNLLHYEGSVIVNDPKGEAAAITAMGRYGKGSKIIVINPFGVMSGHPDYPELKTSSFNPLAEFDPESPNFSDQIGVLAEALILPDGPNGKFFVDNARKLIKGLIAYVCAEPGETRTLPRVGDLLNAPEETDLEGVISFGAVMRMMAKSRSRIAREAALPFLADDLPRSMRDVLSTARVQMDALLSSDGIRHVLSGSDFRWNDLKERTTTVYIVMPEAEAKTYSRFTRLLFASALKALMQLPKAKAPVLLLMDECATSLGDAQMEAIDTAMNLGRGYGVRLWLFFQNCAQMKATFGDKAASLESGAGVTQYFRVSDDMTFKKLQGRAGQTTLWRMQTSQNQGWSQSQNGRHESRSGGTSTSTVPERVPLIDEATAYEGLGQMRPENGYEAGQVLFVEGLAYPALAARRAYWMTAAAALARPNPFKA